MNFDEIKERITSELKQLWEKIQDSSLYNNLRDRYENLTPAMQKIVMVGVVALVSLFIFSIPWGYWSESSTNVAEFEDRRDLVRKLLKTSREAADIPDIPQSPSTDTLQSEIQTVLQENQLLETQIKGVQAATVDSNLIPVGMAQGGLAVSLEKLNLKQIVEIGYKIKAISPTVKVTAMQIFPNKETPQYFDVNFKVVSLAVPQAAPPPAAEEPEDEKPKRGIPRKKTKSSEDEE